MFYSSSVVFNSGSQFQDRVIDNIPSNTNYRVSEGTRLIVRGSIGDNVTIPQTKNLAIEVSGNIGKNVSIKNHNGDISVRGNVGSWTSLKSHNGDFIVNGSLGSNVSLSSHNGDFEVAGELGQNVSFNTHNGDIQLEKNPAYQPTINIYNGKVKIAGRNRTAEFAPENNGNNIVINNVGRTNSVYINSAVSSGRNNHVTVVNNGSQISGLNFGNLFSSLNSNGFFSSGPATYTSSIPSPIPSSSNPSISNSRNKISNSLTQYINGFQNSDSFTDAFERLGIDAQENDCMCAVSLDVPNKPVRVDGVLFDYSSLLGLPVAEDGTREHPLSREKFYMDQVQPDRECKTKIEALIMRCDTAPKF